MNHQPQQSYYLVEVEKESADAVFYFLKENKLSVFINPTQEIIEKYLPFEKNIFIVKYLISEAPTMTVESVITATIEKILVDIFCDELLFSSYQGAEMQVIFTEAMNKYTLNQSKMRRYASRRNQKEAFDRFIETITKLRR